MTTPPKTSRLKQRLDAKREDNEDALASIKSREQEAMEKFESYMRSLHEILTAENHDLSHGDTHKVADYLEPKKELVTKLEGLSEIVSPLFKENDSEYAHLVDLVRATKEALNENGILIERLSTATSAIARALEKAIDRHSLNGIYEGNGKVRKDKTAPTQRFDGKM